MHQKKHLLLLSIILFTIGSINIFSSCSSSLKSTVNNNFQYDIVEKYWKLIEMKGDVIEMHEEQESSIFIILKAHNNSLIGFGGCNEIKGKFELKKNNHIDFSKLLPTTSKLCPETSIIEMDFLEMLKHSYRYVISNDTLILYDKKRISLATFEAVYL